MVSDINHILLSSSKLSFVKENQSFKALPPLQKGQLISAKVVKALSGRQSRIILFGKTIVAKTHIPLKTGENILLRVVKATPPPVFKIEQSESLPIKPGYDPAKLLGRTGPFKHMEDLIRQVRDTDSSPSTAMKTIHRFVRLIQTSALQSEQTRPGMLNRLIETSGLKWEHKLAAFFSNNTTISPEKIQELLNHDMKALSMKAASQVPADQQATLQSMRSFSEGIETLQLLNQHLFEESGRFLLHLPILFDGTLNFGQLLIDLNQSQDSKNQDDRPLRISFLLEMTRLGEFLADFSILKNQIIGSFGVANQEIQAFIKENLPGLESKLSAHGFDVTPISCKVLSPETLAGTSLIEKALSDSGQGVLNIVI